MRHGGSMWVFTVLLVSVAHAGPVVRALPADVVSGGDWHGRRGRRGYVLCGMLGLTDADSFGGRHGFVRRSYLGESAAATDWVRRWLHWPWLPKTLPPGADAATVDAARGPAGRIAPGTMPLWQAADLRRVLTNPVHGGRRQASWDDHAEAYSPWFERSGPHLYLDIVVPAGRHVLALYFATRMRMWGSIGFATTA